ncbi:hypothetical protein BGW38_001015, partial [Lunasporangiospora selenospora]
MPGSNSGGATPGQILASAYSPSNSTPHTLAAQGRQGSTYTSNSDNNGGGVGYIPGSAADDDGGANSGLHSLTRAEVHQSLDMLKRLVTAAESYRELSAKLAKTTKQLGRCFKEYGDCKGMDNTYVMCLKSSANFYESFSEMESKLASSLQKDFEIVHNNWEKHTKRISKDEKAHDEVLGDLDERIKKISSSYDKKSKKPDPNTALMSHELRHQKYISTLTELQDSIATAKKDHRNTVARRERYTHSLTAQVACRLAEAQFLAIERQLRGSGPSLLKIKEWAPFAGIDMPPPNITANGSGSDYEPTIEIRTGGSFEEYSARHIQMNTSMPGAFQTNGAAPGMLPAHMSMPMPMPMPMPTPTPVQMPTLATSPQPATTGAGSSMYQPGSPSDSKLPPIVLPPFAPMQQHLQQQQTQQDQGSLVSTIGVKEMPTNMPDPKQYISTKPSASVTSSIPLTQSTPSAIMTTKTTPGSDHKVLVKEGLGPTSMITKTITTGIEPAGKEIKIEKKPITLITTATTSTGPRNGGVMISGSSTKVTMPGVLTTSPTAAIGSSSTPGAFPTTVTSTSTTPLPTATTAVSTAVEGSFPEAQRSLNVKVDSIDSDSTLGERRREHLAMTRSEYTEVVQESRGHIHRDERALEDDLEVEGRVLHGNAVLRDEDGEDEIHMDDRNLSYERRSDKYLDRVSAYVEDVNVHHRGSRDRRDEDLANVHPDDVYAEPYSPLSPRGDDGLGDMVDTSHVYYDEDDLLEAPDRRYFDDEESEHSGSIPIRRDREPEYYGRTRYDDDRHLDYDRGYGRSPGQGQGVYSSSMPTGRSRASYYLDNRERERERDRDIDHPVSSRIHREEWAVSSTAAAVMASAVSDAPHGAMGRSGGTYAREQYPATRDYPPSRPTLEDREREMMEMMGNQKAGPGERTGAFNAASSSAPGTARSAAGAAYTRRPGTSQGMGPGSGPGTVANLRRRYSDLSISDVVSSPSTTASSPTSTQRPRGMSGTGTGGYVQQQHEALMMRRGGAGGDPQPRYPPPSRSMTPQSRATSAGTSHSTVVSSNGGYRYTTAANKSANSNGRYSVGGTIPDYEDGRVSVAVGPRRR